MLTGRLHQFHTVRSFDARDHLCMCLLRLKFFVLLRTKEISSYLTDESLLVLHNFFYKTGISSDFSGGQLQSRFAVTALALVEVLQ